nr:histone deacetylase 14 [Tanacetum cinerariifolium]
KVTTENMNLKTGVSKATVNPLVSTRDKHVIDVELIFPRLRNNRNAHLDYLRHLKESVEMIRDIVEEAKVVSLLDKSIVSACRYTKHSQELLEYVIGTCPHGSQPRAKQLDYIPLIRKKQVIVAQTSNKLDSITHPHVVTVTSQKINVPVPPSTRVDCFPIARGSQPMIRVKPNRISLVKDKMADVNAPSDQTPTMAPPVRTDDQILPHIRYLKFSAKGTKREIFGMPIPGRLITENIREASYNQEYQENVAKHRGFLDGETGSTQDLPAPKPAKPARKPQSTAQKAPPKPSISSSVTSTQPAPTSVANKDADFQKVVKESIKDAYALPKGPLPPVVIRKLESGKYQPLLEVPGKGKAKVSRQSDIEEESEKIMLRVEKGGQDEGQAGPDPDAQVVDQTRSDAGAQAEGQDGSNPDETSEGQTGSNRDETSEDREHMDLDDANVSPQPSTEQLYEGFTATVYPNVQENLKLAVEEPVLLEEPASSSGTLSSLQHLSRDFSFGDQFFSDKHLDADKSAETEVESIENKQLKATTTDTTTTTTTTLPLPQAQQQITTEAMMVKRIGELEHILADLIQVNKTIEERLDKHGARLYTLKQLDIPQQVSIAISEVVTDAVDWDMQAPLCNRFIDLPEADMKEILHQRMWESDSYKSHEDHMQLFKALENLINRDHSEELAHDLAEARKKRKKGRESPKTPPGSPSHQPPPPPPPAGPSGNPSKGSAAPSPSKMAATTKHQAWTTLDVTLKTLVSLTPEDLDMDEAMGPDEQAQLSDEEDIMSAHIPMVNLRQGWWKPFEEERPTTLEPAWSIRSSDVPVPMNNWASALASNYSPPPEDSLLAQTVDITTFMDCVDDPILRHSVSKPLPLGGPPGQVTIQSDLFFNKDLEYLRYGSKGRRPALSILKMKAAYYPDAGLEQMVPD